MQVQIERHTTAQHINAIVNHEEVYPWVRGLHDGPLDLTAPLQDENVIALLAEHGGQIYGRMLPGLWEAHSQFTPEGRGDYAVAATRESLKWMFTRTDAVEIMTRCPSPQSKALAKSIGGTLQWTNPKGWVVNGREVAADIYSLTIQDWMRTAPGLVEKGQWFHARLAEELARHGIEEPAHADDPVHDRYVGAAVEMFLGGQPGKGAVFYNRFAAFAGYAPITIVAADPLLIDIGTAVLAIGMDDFSIHAMPQPDVQH